MADTDVQNVAAESSAAAAVPTFTPPTEQAAYDKWRMGGASAEKQDPSQSEDSAPSDPAKAPTSAVAKTETAADPETAKTQEQKPRGSKASAQERLEEVLADLKRAGLSPAELKSFKREQQAKLETTEPPKAAPEKTVQPAKLEAPAKPVRPDPNDAKFKTWEDYEKAERQYQLEHDDYVEKVADYKAKKAVEEDRAARAQEDAKKTLAAELVEVKKRYPDFEERATPALQKFFNDPEVPDFIKGTVGSSDVKHDLIYALGEPETWDKIVEASKTDPRKALKAIFAAEDAIAAELGKAKAAPDADKTRDESGKFVAQNAPEKTVSKAPPPPKEVGGHGSRPADEAETAFKNNDFEKFSNSRNRRDVERSQGR